MGAKQTKLNGGQNVINFNETSLENLKLNGNGGGCSDFNNSTKLRVKRRKANNHTSLNRSSSSPVIAKWRFSGFFNDTTNNNNNTTTNTTTNNNNNYNNNNINQSKFNLELNGEHKTIDSHQNSSTTSSSNTNTSTHTSKSIQQSPEIGGFSKNLYSNNNNNNNNNHNGSLNGKNKAVELNQQLKYKQQTLNNIIKQNELASQPSYHLNSKLYRISSIKQTFQYNNNNNNNINATSISSYQNFPRINEHSSINNNNNNNRNNNNNNNKSIEITKNNNNNNKISEKELKPQNNNNNNNNNLKTSKSNNNLENSNLKTPVASKIAKRLGLSPRFKRKIVETIANKVTSHQNNLNNYNYNTNNNSHQQQNYINANQKLNNQNSIFSQSRLFQALQSQWNLLTSVRLNRNDSYSYNSGSDEQNILAYGENENETISRNNNNNKQRNSKINNNNKQGVTFNRRRTETTATFLSTSLQRNSFRYASRRKYKTQSLANPYRHANTNYPVYIHEALFMPEFSVKGQVTEADFEILDVISRGAFGHVIKVKKKGSATSGTRATHDNDNDHDHEHDHNRDHAANGVQSSNNNLDESEQVFAMKIMWKSQVIRDRALQQVKDEVTIAVNCVDNPLIVKTWYYWQSKRFLYIITDYVENGELLSLWLKVHHFPERLVVLYAVEMCLVLDYLHRKGIIYRDIKMENILLDHRGHVQLIDFGLSKWLKLGEKTSTICGTIQYMAPEILSVEPYDHAADWWSLGILIYALLSGEYPLNAAKDHIQMNERVSKHNFELDRTRGYYSDEACDLVKKLLRKSPQKRLKSLSEMKAELFFKKEIDHFLNMFLKLEETNKSIAAAADAETGENGENKEINNKNQNKINNSYKLTAAFDINIIDEQEKRIIKENFWNPYVIINNYSPLELLFEEIYAIKHKQTTNMNEKIKNSQQQQQQPPSNSNEQLILCEPSSNHHNHNHYHHQSEMLLNGECDGKNFNIHSLRNKAQYNNGYLIEDKETFTKF